MKPSTKKSTSCFWETVPKSYELVLYLGLLFLWIYDHYIRATLIVFPQGLLLLQQLTKGNAAIQKIVAFENAFERLLDIITEEGSSDGGKVEWRSTAIYTLKLIGNQ